MIYSKPISEITWEDIVDFCNQQIVEGATLDYKQDFPKDLSKTVAAFANTMGGIVLLGVEENNENKPILPIQGLPFERGLADRVLSIILSNITPPIIPEINVCLNNEQSKAIVVIRIPQSDQTPHAINQNTKVYIRAGSRNNAEELISIDKLEGLLNNRKKSHELREKLIRGCNDRFQKHFQKESSLYKLNDDSTGEYCRMTLILSPVFPTNYFCTPPKLRQILEKIYVPDSLCTSKMFPIDRGSQNSILYQNGLTTGFFIERYAYYTDLNSFGIYYYKQNMFKKFYKQYEPDNNIIRIREVKIRIEEFLDSANLFYEQIGFQGLLTFEFSIIGLPNFYLQVNSNDLYTTLEQSSEYADKCLSGELSNRSKEFVNSTILHLGWSYNININLDS